nr:hypothetical protein GCM10020092_076950 [Actinoplanes digitatis]
MAPGYGRSLVRTTLFALAYAGACYVGRRFWLGYEVNLVWPAAGVAVVWFCAHRRAPTRRLDMLLLTVILGGMDWLTGYAPAGAVVAGFVGLIQVTIFLWLFHRWGPHLWGAGGNAPLRSPRDLWILLGAALAATVAAKSLNVLGQGSVTDGFPILVSAMSVARHMASILIIGSAGICAGAALTRLRAEGRSIADRWRDRGPASPWRVAEIAGIYALGIAGYVAVFASENHFPLAFALIGVTVLVGTRLSTPWVLAYNALVWVVALWYTVAGFGPFALIDDVVLRAAVVQLFAVMVALVGLALALGRDERRALLGALAQEKAELAAQKIELATQKAEITHHADLLAAIIDSMGDGLAVIGPDRRVTLTNPAITELFGGRARHGLVRPLPRRRHQVRRGRAGVPTGARRRGRPRSRRAGPPPGSVGRPGGSGDRHRAAAPRRHVQHGGALPRRDRGTPAPRRADQLRRRGGPRPAQPARQRGRVDDGGAGLTGGTYRIIPTWTRPATTWPAWPAPPRGCAA